MVTGRASAFLILTLSFHFLSLFAMQRSPALLDLRAAADGAPLAPATAPIPITREEGTRLGQALLEAASREDIVTVLECIEKGADVHVRGRKQRTALMCIFKSSLWHNYSSFLVQEFLRVHVNPNAVDENNFTALCYALQRAGDFSHRRTNLFYIAEDYGKEKNALLMKKEEYRNTMQKLKRAIEKFQQSVGILQDEDEKITAKQDKDSAKAIVAMMQDIVEIGATIDLVICTIEKVQARIEEIIKIIFEIDLNVQTVFTAVQWLLSRMSIQAVNEKTNTGDTAIHYAALIRDHRFALALIQKGAAIDEKTEQLAMECGNIDTLQVLKEARNRRSQEQSPRV